MMLCAERYRVITSVAVSPQLNRIDIVHNLSDIDTSRDAYMARILHIEPRDGKPLTAALLDTVCSDTEYCAVLEEDLLTVIRFDSIVRIDLETGRLIQCPACKNTGGLLEIHPVKGGYILWGEGEILGYDQQLNRIWSFSGRDIFVVPTGEKAFQIADGRIHCRDWAGWKYVLDFAGNLLDEVPPCGGLLP